MNTSRLVELIDAHKHAYGVSEAELARRIGITRQNMHLWRTHGVRGLPARTTLDGIAAELRLPYAQVLEAAFARYRLPRRRCPHRPDQNEPTAVICPSLQ